MKHNQIESCQFSAVRRAFSTLAIVCSVTILGKVGLVTADTTPIETTVSTAADTNADAESGKKDRRIVIDRI